MTGYENLEIQRTRMLRVVGWGFPVLITAWIWSVNSESQLVAQTVIVATFLFLFGKGVDSSSSLPVLQKHSRIGVERAAHRQVLLSMW